MELNISIIFSTSKDNIFKAMELSGIRNMQKSLIAIFTAASVLLITPVYTVLASETQNDSSKATCQKPPEPPKDKDGKPLPPPEGKKPPTGSDGKPLSPPDGCKPPEHDKTKG